MINNPIKYLFHVVIFLFLIPGINSFVLSGKTFHISPIYRINKSKFTLLSGSDTLNTVTELVAQRFDKKKEEIDPNSDFYKEFGADTLDKVELLILLEDEFDLNIPDNHFRTLKSIKEISRYIDGKLQLKDRINLTSPELNN
ncbi:Phosphopantetheine attachment site family protein [Theileria parva strain Muguga]|uniref:Acyl carrier protein n=1 Tax=Theileria parva TaxID=5875 RepID=Q4N4D2_THEPA|nr:Phosphopantetheine attachment site family protein [Theileria parva strain Muguga]EAN32991.1 Phosphopantetheine attachment site family protein [Theileria parva strain Muguga]|eukprot:XP_765274.1 acyl carrier protein [Theileria parva strain Muguga]